MTLPGIDEAERARRLRSKRKRAAVTPQLELFPTEPTTKGPVDAGPERELNNERATGFYVANARRG